MPSDDKLPLLVAEDDAHLRYFFEAAALRSDAFGPLIIVPDGQAAWEQLERMRHETLPALIVTDLSMPRMDGIELVRALKSDAQFRAIPVAVITSSDLPNDRELALAAGACAFLRKPHGIEALKRALLELRNSCIETASAAARG
jgi:CheY-like chemotaxis protein